MTYADELKLTLTELAQGFTAWRSQVLALARNELGKSTKKTALGWFWLFFQPAVYIFCFWFALYVGIKSAKAGLDGIDYLLWLAAGVIPWWFMRQSLNTAPSMFTSHAFLVNKLKFPVALIPVFAELSPFMLHLMLMACLIAGYFLNGGALTVYFLQLPLLMLLMLVFFTGYSMLVGVLCAFSKDLAQLLKALTTPIFWLSGIIFDVTSVDNSLVQTALLFDPVSFFTVGFRKALSGVDPGWIWDDPLSFGIGIAIIVLTCALGVLVFAKLRRDLPDVL
ncbi:MAG: ABC transporter permease [Coriobacteriales bacterium]